MKQEALLTALLTAESVPAAAAVVGISEQTAWRWLREPDFKQRLNDARQEAFSEAVQTLKAIAGEAVATLRDLLQSESDGVRLRAAVAVLEQAAKGVALLELEERLSALEEAAGQGRRPISVA